ncbi:SurA N-terminal domain-containing protein [Reichenbachiella sp. 5M10]|uniref:peptidylprolyl isomerase n=1 Tax=Reichenbachiella sp. 5M10 TaxID=1889772 RepID=UPI000C15B125|nr:SurA N-terminal domain-containing protein [Reichenbachiella sp. 5M10]
MALINTLRNKGGKIVIGLIGFSIVAFIGADLLGPNSRLFGASTDVGEIAGQTISYQDFLAKQEEMTYNFQMNQGRSPSGAEQDYIRNQTWDALIGQYAFETQFKLLGLRVSKEEIVDMVQGDNISPQIRQAFTNPETGAFEKENVIAFLQRLSEQTPQQRASWYNFENSLAPSRQRVKYNNLILKTNYATEGEAKFVYASENNNAEVNYIYVPFYSIEDSAVSVTDAELKAYLSKHEDEFKAEASRAIQYVVIDVVPSATDSAVVKEDIMKLVEGFETAESDSLYALVNSDMPGAYRTYTAADQLPAPVQGADTGVVVGPLVENGSYVLYKVTSASEEGPYKVAKVALELYVSDDTRNSYYRDAEKFAFDTESSSDFEANATAAGLRTKSANKLGANDQRLPGLNEARNIVYWAYNKASIGDVSDVFEIENQYVIATLVSEQEEGSANLASVKNEVRKKVIDEKKAEIITQKLNGIEGAALANKIIQYDGNNAKYYSMSNLKLSSNSLTSVGLAPKAIGVAFSMEPGEVSEPFAIDNGVIQLELINKIDAPEVSNYENYRNQATTKRQARLAYSIDQAVRELADIKDERYKFF